MELIYLKRYEDFDGIPQYGQRLPSYNPVIKLVATEFIQNMLSGSKYFEVFKNAGVELKNDDLPNKEQVEEVIEYYYNNPEEIPQEYQFGTYPVNGGDGVARIFGSSQIFN